ncbi:acyl-CoA dehydrogenase family protein [Nocardia vinacea]|uniref:Acyl-CoA dehydrogenase family protein n=1 Tax=Nocardia vinacea TaxID=96468 RepID=A0ABZ1YXB5_9NOCA|nr:acyl-CoA dehydrogenase family protein [Nocardia vinacea]
MSKPLIDYTRTLKEWSTSECRPYAREADSRHELPQKWREILDTAPVPLGRSDRPGSEPVPEFEDGYWVTRLAFYEAVAYGDVWALQALGNGIGHLVVQAAGTPEQVERWYKPVMERGLATGFALTEPHFGSDTSQVAATAVRDGDSWIINGNKIFCSYGASSEYVVVFATIDPAQGGKGIRAFVVEKGTPGFAVVKPNEHKMGIRAWVTSALAFDDCRIPVQNGLGWRDGELKPDLRGQAAALATLALNRPNISGMAIGITQAAIDLTNDLLNEQKSEFTRLRWSRAAEELAQMNVTLERGRRAARHAQRLLDLGRSDRLTAASAKAFAPHSCERIIRRCMQLLGPDGASEDLLLEKWYRDMKIMDIFEGSGEIQRLIVARELIGKSAA